MPPPSETRRHFHGAARGIHAHFETGNFAESVFRLLTIPKKVPSAAEICMETERNGNS